MEVTTTNELQGQLEQPSAVGVCLPVTGSFSGDPHEMPRPPPAASTFGIRLSSDVSRAIHDSVGVYESCSLVCKVVGIVSSSRQVQDLLQGALLSLIEIMNVSPLGKGCFRVSFKTPDQADAVLARSPVDLGFGLGIFARWTHGMDLSSLNGGLIVTARFPGLLPEYVPYVKEIGGCIGYVVGDVSYTGEDKTPCLRMVLPPSLAKDPPQLLSFPTIHGGEHLQRVFFIGLPGHCFICGRKGHLAANCTRRRVSSQHRQDAVEKERIINDVGEEQPVMTQVESPKDSIRDRRQRSNTERARRRAAKKRKRKFARLSEGLRVEMVYRRRIPPSSSVFPSTSAQPSPPPTSLHADPVVQQSSSSFSEGESSSYEKLFPTLSESCKKSPVMELRRSTRKKGKA